MSINCSHYHQGSCNGKIKNENLCNGLCCLICMKVGTCNHSCNVGEVGSLHSRATKAEKERDALERQLQAAALFTGMRLSCKHCPINCDSTKMVAQDCIDKLREHWRQMAEIIDKENADKVKCKNCGGKGNVQIVRNGIPCRGIETCPVCNGGKGARA